MGVGPYPADRCNCRAVSPSYLTNTHARQSATTRATAPCSNATFTRHRSYLPPHLFPRFRWSERPPVCLFRACRPLFPPAPACHLWSSFPRCQRKSGRPDTNIAETRGSVPDQAPMPAKLAHVTAAPPTPPANCDRCHSTRLRSATVVRRQAEPSCPPAQCASASCKRDRCSVFFTCYFCCSGYAGPKFAKVFALT